LREDDLTVLHEWLLRPHVAVWWGPADSIDELRSNYLLSVDQSNATRAYIPHRAGNPIAFTQFYLVFGGRGGPGAPTGPGPRNETAIRSYAAAGFYPVGPIVTPDGHALLMRCDRPQVRLIHTRRFLVEPDRPQSPSP